jgi:hypothetical protein
VRRQPKGQHREVTRQRHAIRLTKKERNL